jgi:hypothetical protein
MAQSIHSLVTGLYSQSFDTEARLVGRLREDTLAWILRRYDCALVVGERSAARSAAEDIRNAWAEMAAEELPHD